LKERIPFKNREVSGMEEERRIDLDKTNSLLIETLLRLMPEPGSFDTGIKGSSGQYAGTRLLLRCVFWVSTCRVREG
jgi:hypothetical protein